MSFETPTPVAESGSTVDTFLDDLLNRSDLDDSLLFDDSGPIGCLAPGAQAVLDTHEPKTSSDRFSDLTLFSRHSPLISRLDRVIADGELFSRSGPSGADQTIVSHGLRAFTTNARNTLRDRQRAAAALLDALFRKSFVDGAAQAASVMIATGHYLTAQTPNAEIVAMARRVSEDETIAVQSLRTASLGMAIALEIGKPLEEVRTVGLCGLIHDWGMLKISPAVRRSPTPLSRVDVALIKQHPVHVFEMLEKLAGVPVQLPPVCAQIHEAPDGSGYPRARKAHAIHPLARIVRVADIYVALTSPRPWRKALTPNGAMECLLSLSAENRVDSEVVNKLLAAVSLFPAGSLVELSDGSVAQSLRPDGIRHSQPFVRLVRDKDGRPVSGDEEIQLSSTNLRIIRALPRPGADETELTAEILDHGLK